MKVSKTLKAIGVPVARYHQLERCTVIIHRRFWPKRIFQNKLSDCSTAIGKVQRKYCPTCIYHKLLPTDRAPKHAYSIA